MFEISRIHIPNRSSLSEILSELSGTKLQNTFNEPWLNKLVPSASAMIGCEQGTVIHLEGDVAVHTGSVFDEMRKTASRRFGRPADFIELLAAVLHDSFKPLTRVDHGDGTVSFPNHEKLAGDAVPEIARQIGLTPVEAQRLEFIVRHHGDVHGWPQLSDEFKETLRNSVGFESLALLQEADAKSCVYRWGSIFLFTGTR